MPTTNSPTTSRVAMIVTRSLDDEPYLSRVRTLRAIHTAIDTTFGADVYRLQSILETKNLHDILYAGWVLLVNLLRFSPLPLQCILYTTRSNIKEISSAIEANGYERVYLDTVRCISLLRAVTKLNNNQRNLSITVDFDDLFSRRMHTVVLNKMPLSLGFAQKYFPTAIRRAIEGPLARLINRHEAATLSHVEHEIAYTANSIVLVSQTERTLFAKSLSHSASAVIHAIPPPALPQTNSSNVTPPVRFVFIGSDRQIHNRLSINFLLEMWRRLKPTTELHIYGKQQAPQRVPNVIWHGFVDELSDVYTNHSILILPALLSGGVKTKVVEAWAHGRPVLGNHAAFEGVQIPEYPLQIQETDWTSLVTKPNEHLATYEHAAQLGLQFVRTRLSPAYYGQLWRKAMTPSIHATESPETPSVPARSKD